MKDFNIRLEKLVTSMAGKDRIEAYQTDELFLLHNHYYPNQRETGKSCPPCRGRVLNKMIALWATLKDA